MEEKIKLLKLINHDSKMGQFSTDKLLKSLEGKDNKIKGLLRDILEKYEHFDDETTKILENEKIEVKEPNFIEKIWPGIGIEKEVMNDNSDSKMADVMIQGITMGVIEMKKKLSEYEKELDDNYKDIAKRFLEFQEDSIEKLKKYL